MFWSLLSRARTVWEGEGGLSLVDKTCRYVGGLMLGEFFYNRHIIKCIRSFAAEHQTFIDVGAHIGIITAAVADCFRICLAIEPSPLNLVLLRKAVSLKGISNCMIIPCALGDRIGIANLYLSSTNTADNSLARRDGLERSIQVRVATLDSLIEEVKVGGGFLTKLDVQGYELNVLRGASKTLTKHCLVISELWPAQQQEELSSTRIRLQVILVQGFQGFTIRVTIARRLGSQNTFGNVTRNAL